MGCSCRGRWGLNWGETNLTLQGLGEGKGGELGGGVCVFYQVGGCWTASRSETSGIDWRYSAERRLAKCRWLPARRRLWR